MQPLTQRSYTPSDQGPVRIQSGQDKAGLPSTSKPAPSDHTNSEDQNRAREQAAAFLLDHKQTCFSLIGPAGSGKTTLIRQIIADAEAKGWPIALTAPTHQAAARIREATGRSAETTHRALSVSLIRDEKTGNEYLKAKGTPSIGHGSVLVVDEGSMTPDQLLKIILKFAEKKDCKVIFVGDAAQLNPVKEKPSITVDRDNCPWQMAELTEIHRQAAENPIIRLATAIRLADPRKLPAFATDMNGDTGVMHYADKRAWADAMVSQCGLDDRQDRYIAYTNRATDEAAKAIRRKRFGADAEQPYLPGELLVVNSRCVLPEAGKPKKKKKRSEQTVIQANDTVIVTTVWRDQGFYFVEADWHGHRVVIKALASYHEREKHLASIKRVAIMNQNWSDFFEATDTIADLRSATTMTVHSSQGSTFDDVFLNLHNLSICRNPEERQRLLYVAVTRASGCVKSFGALT